MKKKIIMLLIYGFSITIAVAQQAPTATGGSALGSGGVIDYSVGQVVYTTNQGSSNSETQGVQQPYEISTVLGIKNFQISLNIETYPNPTNDYVVLNLGKSELSTLNYQLFDINGKLIENKKIVNTIETIKMESLPSATYLLKVTNNNEVIKTFKIIKN